MLGATAGQRSPRAGASCVPPELFVALLKLDATAAAPFRRFWEVSCSHRTLAGVRSGSAFCSDVARAWHARRSARATRIVDRRGRLWPAAAAARTTATADYRTDQRQFVTELVFRCSLVLASYAQKR